MKNGIDASHLPDPNKVTSEDTAVEAYSQVLGCVHRANGELAKPRDTTPGYDTEHDRDDLSDHLTEWLLAIHRLMKVIVHYIPHVDTYSFTFGTTISMTMNFVKHEDRRVSRRHFKFPGQR
jgi:hypothetical protein